MFDQNNNENVFVFSEYQSISGQPMSRLLSPEVFNDDSTETDDRLTIISNDLTPKLYILLTGTNEQPPILASLSFGLSVNGQQPPVGVKANVLGTSIETIQVY